jgi:hypothetical protein
VAYKLEVELVPRALWGKSLREQYPTQWEKLKDLARAWAGNRCEICGGIGEHHPVEIHEVWEYTVAEKTGIQKLLRLIALCPMCHAAKHYGRSSTVLYPDDLRKLRLHMMSVNGYTEKELNLSLTGARRIWDELNELEWSQDLSSFFAVYACKECGKTRGLQPVVTKEEADGIIAVEWLCKTHEAIHSEECYCHGLRISNRAAPLEGLHNMGESDEYEPVAEGTEDPDNIWWQGSRG